MPQPHSQRSRRAQAQSQRNRSAQPSTATRSTQSSTTPRPVTQRRLERPATKPIDYSQDYAFAVRDLKRIALWSILLFVGMFAIYFVK